MTRAFIVWGYDDTGKKVYYPSSKSSKVDAHSPTHAKLNPTIQSARQCWMWTDPFYIEEVEVNLNFTGNIIKVENKGL